MARLNLIPENAETEEKPSAPKKTSKWLCERKVGPFRMDAIDMIGFVLLLAILVSVMTIKIVMHPVIVRGTSMNPTYEDGDVLRSKTEFTEQNLQCGKIIVFDSGNKYEKNYIKRIEGIPGDTIQIRDGVLYRNGEKIEEGFEKIEDPGDFSEETVLTGYFVLGDNRNNSQDSRFIGEIGKKKILAVIEKEEKLFHMPEFL